MKLFSIMSTAFDNFDTTVHNYLARTFINLGMQYTHTQVFNVIFDGLKGIMQNALFYIEDALTEQNIFTAMRRESVFSLAKLSGYEPYYGAAAVGTLIGRLAVNNGLDNKTTKIYIEDGTTVVNRFTGVTYTIVLPTQYYVIDIAKPLMTHEFKIVQGYYETADYAAQGNNWETVSIGSNELFDRQYVTVTVDGEQWEECSTLYDMVENGKQFVLTTGFNNSFDIMFGNGNYGKRLEEGQTVQVRFLRHIGTTGNIAPNAHTEWSFTSYLYDSLGNTVNGDKYIILTLSSCMSGGTDSDNTAFVRSMVGYNSRSLVLASENNFKLFFKRFSFVGYVNCWSEKNSMCITATCLRNINEEIKTVDDYYNMDTNNLLLTDGQKEMIQTTLKNSKKAFAGVTMKFQDPVIRRFSIICYAKVDNIYNRDAATDGIRTSLAKYFMNIFEGVQFIPKSDLITKILDENDCVTSVDIDIISELAEQTYKQGYYDRYELKFVNGSYQYIPKRVMYEPDTYPALDQYGNISLGSKLEIPVLQGSFKYYPDKDTFNKSNCVSIPTVQVYFI